MAVIAFLLPTDFHAQQNSEKDSLLSVYYDTNSYGQLSNNKKIDLLNELANVYRFRNPDSIKFFVDKSLELNENKVYKGGYMETLIRYGDYYSDSGFNTRAKKKYDQADSLSKTIQDPKRDVFLLKSLALHNMFVGDLREMIGSTYEAIKICQEEQFSKQEALLRHNLGWLYSNNKLYNEARTEFIIADSIFGMLGDASRRASTRSNMSYNALQTKDFDAYKKYAEDLKSYFKNHGETLWYSRACRITSLYHQLIDDPENALHWLKKSDSALMLVNNPRDYAEILGLYNNIYFDLENYETSKEYNIETIALTKKLKDSAKLLDAYRIRNKIELALGDSNEALRYYELVENLENSFAENTEGKNIKFLRAKLEFDTQQEIENQRVAAELEKKDLWIFIMVLFALGFVIIAYLIRKNFLTQKEATQQLEQLVRDKDKVFAVISHDLRSPITTLQELLKLYKAKGISEKEIARFTPRLKENVDHSSFMLNNLLYWSESQMQGFTTTKSPVNVKKVANEICKLFQEALEKKCIEIKCNIDQNLMLNIDPEHLNIVLRNLISNAIKFSQLNGTINFDSKIIDNHPAIYVCDDGIGMGASQLKAFHQRDSIDSTPGTSKEKGLGIGLSICQDLIAKNGGELFVDSNKNKGSCFWFTLPDK
ncbi:MAG: hypothetical protein ED555_12470 [Allomuricauda sp.]|nr:MAG: hypothetical protein ED555_12470 [Allomuricauda sp.]